MFALHPNDPSLDVAVDSNISAETDLLSKSVTDLQSSISIRNSAITGTSLYVDDYTSAGFDMSISHNFLALHFEAQEGATIQVELIGGDSEGHPVTLDADGLIVLQIRNKSQKVKVTATKNTDVETKTFDLTGLTLASA